MSLVVRSVVICLGLLIAQLSAIQALAQVEYEQGVHYKKLAVPVQTQTADRIEVVEIFSYGCIHCFNFDPEVAVWRAVQSPDVHFRRVPAVFSKSWEALAQAYFTAEILGVTEQVHMPIFTAIHRAGADFRTAEQMANLFNNIAGIDKAEFISVFNSFGVRSQVQQAGADSRMYRITGVPTLVVAGKYVTDGTMAGNNTRMLEVIDFLVQKERELKAQNGD